MRSARSTKSPMHAPPTSGRALKTPRLLLVAATPAWIEAELESTGRLGDVLGAVAPDGWPPEHHDRDTLRFWRVELSKPGAEGWWLY